MEGRALRRSFQQCGGDEVQVAVKAGFSLRVVRASTGGSWTALGVVVRSPGFLFFGILFLCAWRCTLIFSLFFFYQRSLPVISSRPLTN